MSQNSSSVILNWPVNLLNIIGYNFICYLPGGIVNTEALKKVEGRCLIDDTTEYSFLAELPKEGNTFTPTIRLSMPNKRPVSLTGTVTHIPYEKLQGEMRIDNVFTSPVILSCKYISHGFPIKNWHNFNCFWFKTKSILFCNDKCHHFLQLTSAALLRISAPRLKS